MLVPEAASDLDSFSMARQNNIRSTRQFLAVEAEAIAKSMDQATYDDLWLCVLSSHKRHLRAASGVYLSYPTLPCHRESYPDRGRHRLGV